jgi:phage/plasmid-associated DNA primase
LAQHVITLPFNRIFTDAEQVSELERQLLTEKKAIFEWAVEGLHRLLMNNGFTMPPSSVSLKTV